MAERNVSRSEERPKSVASVVTLLRRYETARQFLAFLAVGVLNTAFGYGVFALLYLFGPSYRVAIIIATAIGVTFNYFSTGGLVFAGSGWRILIRFVLGYTVICAVNIVLVDAVVGRGIDPLLAQGLALGVVVPLSFVINKWFVFGSRP